MGLIFWSEILSQKSPNTLFSVLRHAAACFDCWCLTIRPPISGILTRSKLCTASVYLTPSPSASSPVPIRQSPSPVFLFTLTSLLLCCLPSFQPGPPLPTLPPSLPLLSPPSPTSPPNLPLPSPLRCFTPSASLPHLKASLQFARLSDVPHPFTHLMTNAPLSLRAIALALPKVPLLVCNTPLTSTCPGPVPSPDSPQPSPPSLPPPQCGPCVGLVLPFCFGSD